MKKYVVGFSNKYGEELVMTSNRPNHLVPPIKENLKMRPTLLVTQGYFSYPVELSPGVFATNDLFCNVVTEGEVFLCQVNKRERILFETVYLEDDVITSLGLENPYQDMLWLVPLNPDIILDPMPLVPFAKAIVGSTKMKNFDSIEYIEDMLHGK